MRGKNKISGKNTDHHNDPKYWTDTSGQTMQTQIRLVLKEQSDQGLHCLPFCLHLLDALLYGNPHCVTGFWIKIWTPKKIAVIILKFEECSFAIE